MTLRNEYGMSFDFEATDYETIGEHEIVRNYLGEGESRWGSGGARGPQQENSVC